ncbi:hypothetical protein ZWY2020_056204 [Hordeum vulgare]|nr:hypothetical protein ZWY2020_056204 [Hordeum vulgare]
MLVMPNILSLTCICFNSVLYPTSFFFAKLPEAYAIFNPIGVFWFDTSSRPKRRQLRLS